MKQLTKKNTKGHTKDDIITVFVLPDAAINAFDFLP